MLTTQERPVQMKEMILPTNWKKQLFLQIENGK